MSRESLVGAVVRTAKNLGWQSVETDDAGTTVILLVSAPDATEQIVEGPLHGLPKQLKDLGGPELYPATEEYDALKEEFENVVEHSNIVPEVNQPAQAESPPDDDTSAAEDTAAVQVGRVVYVIRVDGKGEVARTVYEDRAITLARNNAHKHGRDKVHLFKQAVEGHISTALPRPVGERHNG